MQLDLLAAERMLSMAVQLEFDLAAARPMSGLPGSNATKALLIGAGAIGSHLALALTREGRHSWTVADGDWLRPHNLARHVLGQSQVGPAQGESLGRYAFRPVPRASHADRLRRAPPGHAMHKFSRKPRPEPT